MPSQPQGHFAATPHPRQLVQRLLDRGDQVRALSRRGPEARADLPGLTWIQGTLRAATEKFVVTAARQLGLLSSAFRLGQSVGLSAHRFAPRVAQPSMEAAALRRPEAPRYFATSVCRTRPAIRNPAGVFRST